METAEGTAYSSVALVLTSQSHLNARPVSSMRKDSYFPAKPRSGQAKALTPHVLASLPRLSTFLRLQRVGSGEP